MDPWVGIASVGLVCLGLVVVLLISASRRMNQSSPDVVAAMGSILDMDYKPKNSSIPWMGFRSLRGFGTFANVLDGTQGGIRVASAQAMSTGGAGASLQVWTKPRGADFDPTIDPVAHRSVAMAFTPPLPVVTAIRRSPDDNVADAVATISIQLELESFNRAFVVHANDPKDAYTVLQQPVMEWMLKTDERLNYETGAMGVLVFGPLMPPEETPMLVATARGFAERIPRSATLA